MKISKKYILLIGLIILLFGIGNVFAADGNDNSTVYNDYQSENVLNTVNDLPVAANDEKAVCSSESDEIIVENWDDIQYYSSLKDKNYVLKLKENTNYYPTVVNSSDSQVIFNNNVTIIGAEGAYIGDSSNHPRNITYTAMKVQDNSGIGITLKGVTFKWISTRYQSDGVFLIMGGNTYNYIEDCHFSEINTNLGHSSVIQIKFGDLIITNSSFTNCTTDFGCLSVYCPNDDPTGTCTGARMDVSDSYFEGNYARTEPGCINNCGLLVVRNSTFYKNSAFWWAGAIHTHGGANTTIYDSNFTDNLAGWNGGALYTYSYLQVYNTIFEGNNCTTNNGGGAIGACKYIHTPYITVKDSLFKDNSNNCWGLDEQSTSGTGRGGAISLMDEGGLDVRNTTFIHNSASIGTAICAISGGTYGSPNVTLIGNKFINHTRAGDVLVINVADTSQVIIKDNYYFNDSFEFKKLRLVAGEKVGDNVILQIEAELKNPNSFEKDILDTTPYDIYVDGVYNMTVIGKTFTLTLKNGKTCRVYAVPSISNSRTNEVTAGIPKEYIYVSQRLGNDNRNGLTRSAPVKTMAKAVELAKTKGNIVIMDGTFSEYNLTIDYNLTITGENNVKFSGNVPLTVSSIFTVTNADLSISGITFDNIKFTGSTQYKDKRIIKHTGGYLTIDNCVFNKNSASGLSGMYLIESPNAEIYNTQFTNNGAEKIYVSILKASEFLIDNSTFANNYAYHSTYNSLIETTKTTTVKGTVTDTVFENNKVKLGCINFDSKNAPLTVSNTRFISNTVGSTNDYASAIKFEGSSLRIDSSLFTGNINLGSNAGVIYAGSSSSVYVSDSIIVNNSYKNNAKMVFSGPSGLKAYKNLNGNWWGNTLENITSHPQVPTAACTEWLVLNISATSDVFALNQKIPVAIDLFTAADANGNTAFYDAGRLPSFDMTITAKNGKASASKVSIVKGAAKLDYILQSLNGGSLTAFYNNINSTIDFNWGLINPDIKISADDIEYGNSAEITINVPSDIDKTKLILSINKVNYDFKNKITLPKPDAGEYTVNLTFNGDSKYSYYNISKLFKVKKANPELSLTANNIYYGDTTKITVKTAADTTGQIILKIADKTENRTINNGVAEFTINNLKAGDYNITVSYDGDTNYIPSVQNTVFKVKKYASYVKITNTTVQQGRDVTLTFTLLNDATGNITLTVNDKKETLTITQSKATYTIKNIQRGYYTIEAVYDGDDKYSSSKNTTVFDVARLTPSMDATVNQVTYGQDAVIRVTLPDDATGVITVNNLNNTVKNGAGTLNIPDLTAGSKTVKITYSGDNNYLPGEISKTFTVLKAKPTITVTALDVMLGREALIDISITPGTTGTLELSYADKKETPAIVRSGILSTRTLSDLSVGEYTISVKYAGDNNYLEASQTKTFKVLPWQNPQWPNQGYDTSNTGKTPYNSDANGNIKWTADTNGKIISDIAISGDGKIYLTTTTGIYSINSNGNINWIYSSDNAGGDYSGIAVSRGEIISPKINDTLYFINQTTGDKFPGNLHYGSSLFAPVGDENGNIYISGQKEGGNNLVVIPYRLWHTSTQPILIETGSQITNAPVVLNNGLVVVTTEKNILIINPFASNNQIISQIPVISDTRPVIGPGNIIYTISNGNIVSINPDGSQKNQIKITGGAGNYLTVGENGEIYAINNEGKLYDYSSGDETLIYDFKEKITSRLLVGQDTKLYAGSQNGVLYSIDVDGNLLWKVSLNQKIIGSPVMDKNGVIYVTAEDKVIAIDNAPLKDAGLKADIKNITYGEDAEVSININEYATGKITVKIGNTYSNETLISTAELSYTIHGLKAGDYTAEITYDGDERFKSSNIKVKFHVGKADFSMDTQHENINVGETLTVNIINLPADATGTVTIIVNGLSNTVKVENGKAKLTLSSLPHGEYTYTVTYSGDSNYNPKTVTKSVSVGYVKTSFKASAENIKVGEDAVITVTGLPKDANGIIYINDDYLSSVENGNVKITVPGLVSGVYNYEIQFINDEKYSANPQKISFKVDKHDTAFTLTCNNVNTGHDLNIKISNLANDATGNITFEIANITRNTPVGNGGAEISIPQNLNEGTYTLTVTYNGDTKYNSVKQLKTIKISKITPSITVTANNIKVGEDLIITVTLDNAATGNIIIDMDNQTKTLEIRNGIAQTSVSGLLSGLKTVTVNYSGDNRYSSAKTVKTVNISKNKVDNIIVLANESVNVGEELTVTVLNLPDDGVHYIQLIGFNNPQSEIKNGEAKFIISNLTKGEYKYSIYYPGNDKYENSGLINKTVTITKIKPEIRLSAPNIGAGETLTITITLPEDINDESLQLIFNNGESESINIKNGKATYNVYNLEKGIYSYSIYYSSDDKYELNDYINGTVHVGKQDIAFAVNAADIEYGEVEVITISDLPNDSEGLVTVHLNTNTYTAKPKNGKATVNIPNLPAGEYTVNVVYGDDNYAGTVEKSFKVIKTTPSIIINADNIEYGETLEIKVTLPKEITNNIVTLSIDGESKTVEVINGNAVLNVSDLNAGSKKITVKYDGDSNYNAVSQSKTVTVEKTEPVMSIISQDTDYGKDLTVIIHTDKTLTGTITLAVDNQIKTLNIENNMVSAVFTALNAGNKTVKITYNGDSNHKALSLNKNVKISKIQAALTILSPGEVNYGDDLKLDIQMSDNITGSVTVKANSIQKTVSITNGEGFTSISGLNAGNSKIEAVFNGNDNYNSVSATVNVKVNKITPVLTIQSADEIVYADSLNIKTILPADATGNIVLKVGGVTRTVKLNNGEITTSVSDLTVGAKTVTVNYPGDNNYNSVSASKTVNIVKATPVITVVADNIDYGEDLTVKVQMDSRTTGTVSLNVDGIIQNTNVNDGTAVFTVSDLKQGIKNINIVYNGDKNYKSVSVIKTITVNKKTPEITIEAVDINYGEDLKITVHLTDSCTGTVNIDVDGILKTSDIIDSKAEITVSGLTAGSKKINVNYSGDDNHNGHSADKVIAVSKINPSIIILADDIDCGDNLIVKINLNSDVTGIVKISVGDISETLKISNGVASTSVKNLTAGLKTVKVEYSGDNNYNPINLNKTVKVNEIISKTTPQITLTTNNPHYGEDLIITVKSDRPVNDEITVTVNGNSYKINLADGEAKITVSDLASGNTNINVNYNGNNKYNPVTLTKTVNIAKNTPEITVKADSIVNGETAVIIVELPDNIGGDIVLKINGKTYTEKINGEKITFTVDNLPAGENNYDVTYSGDLNNEQVIISSKITVLDSIISTDLKRGYNSGVDFKAVLLKRDGNPLADADVNVIINGAAKTYKTDSSGVLVINDKLNVGKYTITVTNPNTGEVGVNNLEIVKRLTGNKNLVMDYNDGSSFKVLAYGDDGNVAVNETVVMKINGKTYNVKTDADGWAKLGLKLEPKKYTITASYKGVKISNKVTIKSVIKAKNLSKKKAKTIKYSVTLKNSKGKVLKSKKITFKFCGKTYKIKTNKKGVAKLTLKNIKKGKFKIKISYGKDKVTRTIKIK